MYTEALAIVKTTFLELVNNFTSISKCFLISFTVFATRNIRPYLYFFTSIIDMAIHSLSDELE